jgi:uncharacterized protein (TIGR02996 family)
MTQALLAAVCNAPYDDAPRLAYAAWLDSQTPPEPLGEYIRAAIRVNRESLANQPDRQGWKDLCRAQDRFYELQRRHELDWKRPVLAIAAACEFDRGLVASVTVSAERFVLHGGALMDLAPIVHVRLTEARFRIDELASCPHLARVRALSLKNQGLTSKDVASLASSPHVANLWALELDDNAIDVDGVEAMASSQHLASLRHTELAGNPGNVHERAGSDGFAIASSFFPPRGRQLEQRLGYIRWLHYPTDGTFPPNLLGPPPP